jgi:glycerol-3-phosphate dehydrogenase (NAD(P)+)
MQKIGVVGSGAWGTALAQSMALPDRKVIMWAREPEVIESINNLHENTMFLAGNPLHHNIFATNDLNEMASCETVLLVTPAQFVRATLESLKDILTPDIPVVICAKGIEISTGKLLTEVAQEVAPNLTIAVLSGPTFAIDIVRGLPCAVTVSAQSAEIADSISQRIKSRNLRPYVSSDLIGTQIGGAVKNVIAIACGIITGRALGENAKAALMTRGLAEMARLTIALGGRSESLMGMCGVGDLVLTCSSMTSRNFSLGFALGEGKSLEEIMAGRVSIAEGVYTAKAMQVLAQRLQIEMPICEAVNRCVTGEWTIDQAINDLLNRPIRPEGL